MVNMKRHEQIEKHTQLRAISFEYASNYRRKENLPRRLQKELYFLRSDLWQSKTTLMCISIRNTGRDQKMGGFTKSGLFDSLLTPMECVSREKNESEAGWRIL